MGSSSRIEWTGATWNPVRGCSRASEGCRHCYAISMAGRFNKPGEPFEGLTQKTAAGLNWTGKLRLVPEHLADPLRWATPRRIFVNSVWDAFHEALPLEYQKRVADVMCNANWHIFQVLTKRARRMRRLLQSELKHAAVAPHILWGVTVENRATLSRLDDLRETPAKWRFVSFEPLLEDLGEVDLRGIHWIIVGGESGPSARPFREAWVKSLRDQAADAGVPFFFKQWGGKRKKEAGCLLDGREYKEEPLIRTSPAPSRNDRLRMIAAVESKARLVGGTLVVPSATMLKAA